MKTFTTTAALSHKAGAFLLAFAFAFAPVAPALALVEDPAPIAVVNPDVSICHATQSDGNPYNSQSVDAHAIVDGGAGHDSHNDGGIGDVGDIIPPFDYNFGSGLQQYAGKNWNTTGQAIFNHGCVPPQCVDGIDNDQDGFTDYDDAGCTGNPTDDNETNLIPVDHPVTIVATKIVCTDESDLPNYGNGGPNMTNVTATNWVAAHESCSVAPDWNFQWGPSSAFDPGDSLVGPAGAPWTTFGPTNGSGVATVNLTSEQIGSNASLWFREELKDGYIPFAHDVSGNSNNVSAEAYCSTDVLNYDNLDRIDNVQAGGTIYCVAWNVLKPSVDDTTITILKQTTPEGDLQTFSFEVNDVAFGSAIADNGSTGAIVVATGTKKIEEIVPTGWTQNSISCVNEAQQVVGSHDGAPYYVTLVAGDDITCTVTNTKNQVPTYTIDGYKFNDEDGDGFWGEGEYGLPNWTINLLDGENVVVGTTTTDETGYYSFEVNNPANYTTREVNQSGWTQTAALGSACEVNMPVLESKVSKSLLVIGDDDSDFEYFCNFGNHRNPEALSCQLSANDTSVSKNADITLSWDVVNATNVTIDQGVGTVASTGTQSVNVGSSDITYTLHASNSETEDSVDCSVTIDVGGGGGGGGGGSRISLSDDTGEVLGASDEKPVPEVAGAQTAILPAGAPNAGMGGSSNEVAATGFVASFMLMLAGAVMLRRKMLV